ncbi:MAG: hypothetical protein UU77_C0040G0003 [candidate division WWE3 bacterium GW2011_GWC1_41_7]|jgi:hypothetical protein|uniref:YokE-like PH domain-containing protein n=2 Tax=Katanobacteria TaxID=422282 RepID=A0A0G0X418_UNCKA|nr:MAG: hypothetical protein UU72_C0030G0010 [candidate division WWE3 bacterium GW2011_GWB1_41_6]KKS19720.1 MAG: hypothetical protein UU77_C0040G0003 [candidate division WWE3 bacterium GW2011_GWC1_41_7]
MSTLLLELAGNRELNRTMWPPRLLVYDDLLVYRKRRFFRINEITIAYAHIAQVFLVRGIFFASLEIDTSAGQNVKIKYIPKKIAIKAKTIIDRKIYNSLAKHKSDPVTTISHPEAFEKSLNRLRELLSKGKITKREFEQRKSHLLKGLE